MEKRIAITEKESNNVQTLFSTYVSYMNILQFLMSGDIQNKDIFDSKWSEAVEINRNLEKAKRKIEKKYKPTGDWDRFEFDFDNHEVVFVKND